LDFPRSTPTTIDFQALRAGPGANYLAHQIRPLPSSSHISLPHGLDADCQPYAATTNPLSDPQLEIMSKPCCADDARRESRATSAVFGWAAEGPGTGRTTTTMIARQVGALFNVTNAQAVNAFQHVAVEKSRLHIPLLFGLDVIHGFPHRVPDSTGLASTWNPALVESARGVAAQEASPAACADFSPMVVLRGTRGGGAWRKARVKSISRSRWPRLLRGYQGSRLDLPTDRRCAKHFVGYGAAEGGPTTTPPKSPNTPCGSTTCRLFTLL